MWTILASVALAGTPAFYHPDDIAAASKRFTEASEAIQPRFERGQDLVARTTAGLADLEVAVALLGPDAPAGLASWAQLTRRQVTGQYLRLNKHAELIQEDFSKVFLDALGRAMPKVSAGKDVVECKATGVEAMMHRTSCKGEDLNGPLAAAIDADGQLGRDIASILSVDWPTIAVEPAPQPVVPVTGSAAWVDLGRLARTFVPERLAARLDAFERELEPLEEGLAAKDPAAIEAAGKKKQAYTEALAGDGTLLRAAFAEAAGRVKGMPPQLGLCASPAVLGGCVGTDVTDAVIAALKADKKFQKAVAPVAAAP